MCSKGIDWCIDKRGTKVLTGKHACTHTLCSAMCVYIYMYIPCMYIQFYVMSEESLDTTCTLVDCEEHTKAVIVNMVHCVYIRGGWVGVLEALLHVHVW